MFLAAIMAEKMLSELQTEESQGKKELSQEKKDCTASSSKK